MEFSNKQIWTLGRAIDRYGLEPQERMAEEEMAELTVALHHQRRAKCGAQDVITEIADVIIMMQQLAMAYGEDAVQAEIDRKIARLDTRMQNNEKEKIV